MNRQLLKYRVAEIASPLMRLASILVLNQLANPTTPAMTTNDAGANRRKRRPQKVRRLIRPVFSHSLINSEVIKNPESVKKTETPRKPPGNHSRPEWKMMTKMTATPRSPSRPRWRASVAGLNSFSVTGGRNINHNFARIGIGTHRDMRIGNLIKRITAIDHWF